jgi:hypothetical protein
LGPLGIESRGTDFELTNRWLDRSRVEHLVPERLAIGSVETLENIETTAPRQRKLASSKHSMSSGKVGSLSKMTVDVAQNGM